MLGRYDRFSTLFAMSTSNSTFHHETAAEQVALGPDATRIDAAHRIDVEDVPQPVDEPDAAALKIQADQLAAHLSARQDDLDRREAQLQERLAQFERDQQTARLWLDNQQADLNRRREAVQRRDGQVDQSRIALRQLRAELARMHRETLEVRLATEELWSQLSTVAPPEALTRSLGRIRSKLADDYRRANAELIDRKTELETIRGQLATQYEALVQQKRQFEQWADAKREEIAQRGGPNS